MDKPLVWLHGDVRTPPLSKAARLETGVRCGRHRRSLQEEDASHAEDGDRCVQASATCIRRRGARQGVIHLMQKAKKDRLESAGWRVGDAAEFLELTTEETAFVELKLALAAYLRDVREQRGLTQLQVARHLGSSQSRVAKMEAADASVSLDLLVRSLLAMGVSRDEVGRVIATQAA